MQKVSSSSNTSRQMEGLVSFRPVSLNKNLFLRKCTVLYCVLSQSCSNLYSHPPTVGSSSAWIGSSMVLYHFLTRRYCNKQSHQAATISRFPADPELLQRLVCVCPCHGYRGLKVWSHPVLFLLASDCASVVGKYLH